MLLQIQTIEKLAPYTLFLYSNNHRPLTLIVELSALTKIVCDNKKFKISFQII